MTHLAIVPNVPTNLEGLVDFVGRLTQEVTKAIADGSPLRHNVHVHYESLTTPGTANTEFTVTHGMGFIPFMYIWNVDQSAVIYDSNKAGWTTTTMTLKCTVASVGASILVLA